MPEKKSIDPFKKADNCHAEPVDKPEPVEDEPPVDGEPEITTNDFVGGHPTTPPPKKDPQS